MPDAAARLDAQHVGVLNFTASEGSICVPDWIAEQLGLSEYSHVRLTSVSLPKGTFCQLQPLSSAWLDVPVELRLPVLEYNLRNYQTLTQGACIGVMYHHVTHQLRVVDCRPTSAVSIIDTDIEMDLLEPADAGLPASMPYVPQIMMPGQACSGSCGGPERRGMPAMYVVPASAHAGAAVVRINVQAVRGDPDLYVSQTVLRPSRAGYTWCRQSVGNVSLTLAGRGGDLCADQPIFIGIAAIDDAEEAAFVLSVELLHGRAAAGALSAQGKDAQLAPAACVGWVQQSPAAPATATGFVCSNCAVSMLSQMQMLVHERNCIRYTYKCKQCGMCMKTTDRAKHDAVVHTMLSCICGAQFDQYALHRHQQENQCPKRSVPCTNKWCSLQISADLLDEHVIRCKSRSIQCPLCDTSPDRTVLLGEFEYHMEALHNIDTSRIDWKAPVESQDYEAMRLGPIGMPHEKSLVTACEAIWCCCGDCFANLRDLEVHAMTCCPVGAATLEGLGLRAPDVDRTAARADAASAASASTTTTAGGSGDGGAELSMDVSESPV